MPRDRCPIEFELIDSSKADDYSSYFYAWLDNGNIQHPAAVPFCIPLANGRENWSLQIIEVKDTQNPIGVRAYDNPELWVRVLLNLAEKALAPLLDPRADRTKLAEMLVNDPKFFFEYIDKRSNISVKTKQDLHIIVNWSSWKYRGTPMREQWEELKKHGGDHGISFEAYKKRPERLGLY